MWKSKARGNLTKELDWRSVMDGEESLAGVEKDMTPLLAAEGPDPQMPTEGRSGGAKEEGD